MQKAVSTASVCFSLLCNMADSVKEDLPYSIFICRILKVDLLKSNTPDLSVFDIFKRNFVLKHYLVWRRIEDFSHFPHRHNMFYMNQQIAIRVKQQENTKMIQTKQDEHIFHYVSDWQLQICLMYFGLKIFQLAMQFILQQNTKLFDSIQLLRN